MAPLSTLSCEVLIIGHAAQTSARASGPARSWRRRRLKPLLNVQTQGSSSQEPMGKHMVLFQKTWNKTPVFIPKTWKIQGIRPPKRTSCFARTKFLMAKQNKCLRRTCSSTSIRLQRNTNDLVRNPCWTCRMPKKCSATWLPAAEIHNDCMDLKVCLQQMFVTLYKSLGVPPGSLLLMGLSNNLGCFSEENLAKRNGPTKAQKVGRTVEISFFSEPKFF